MNRKTVIVPALLTILAGCAAPAPNLDAQMGSAVEMAKAQQTLHPEASQDVRPVETIDGKSADALINRYHKGFERPPTVNIFNIGVGGSSASTAGPSGTSR